MECVHIVGQPKHVPINELSESISVAIGSLVLTVSRRQSHVGGCGHVGVVFSTECDARYGRWKEAVKRCMYWKEGSQPSQEHKQNKKS